MNKREYLLGFILILVGLSIGFAIGAVDYTDKWINLQQVATDNGGGTSVDEAGLPGIIDKSDTVVDIGPNVQMPWDVGQYSEPSMTAATAQAAWTLSVNNRGIPLDAEYAIIEYELWTGDGALIDGNPGYEGPWHSGLNPNEGSCKEISLEFSNSPTDPPVIRDVKVLLADYGDEVSKDRDQLVVPLVPGTGKYRWKPVVLGMPFFDLTDEPCYYKIIDVGYIK